MKRCPICGKDVPPRAGKRDSVYCSRACLQAHYAEAWETLTCPVCGNVFRAQKLWRRQYCSADCANRAQRGRKITSAAFLEACRHRGVWGSRKHPRTGKFETNCHAKVWRVESPEGEEVTARNLKLYMVTRFGETEGKKIYKLLTCAASRFRKSGRGTGPDGGFWRLHPSRNKKRGGFEKTAPF